MGDELMAMLWLKDAIAGAALAIFFTCCACLPLVAPYGVRDLFQTPTIAHHAR